MVDANGTVTDVDGASATTARGGLLPAKAACAPSPTTAIAATTVAPAHGSGDDPRCPTGERGPSRVEGRREWMGRWSFGRRRGPSETDRPPGRGLVRDLGEQPSERPSGRTTRLYRIDRAVDHRAEALEGLAIGARGSQLQDRRRAGRKLGCEKLAHTRHVGRAVIDRVLHRRLGEADEDDAAQTVEQHMIASDTSMGHSAIVEISDRRGQ